MVGADSVCQVACGRDVVVWFSCIGSFAELVALGLFGLSLWVTSCYSSVSGNQNILLCSGRIVCSWVEMIEVPWVVSLVGLLLVPGVWACLYLVGLPVGICWFCFGLMPLFLCL